jgi:hypothetical protein
MEKILEAVLYAILSNVLPVESRNMHEKLSLLP